MKNKRRNRSKLLSYKGILPLRFMMVLVLAISVIYKLNAQDPIVYSIFLPDLNATLLPVTRSNNPSTLMLLPNIEYGNLGLEYEHESGNFKPVLTEGVNNSLAFSTEKYRFFDKTVVYGSFSVGKKWDVFADYANVEDPYRDNPYVLVDTVGGDKVDRQAYRIKGKVAHSFGKSVFAFAVDYRVGLSAQTRDPRAKIMVNQITFQPGYMYRFNQFDLGFNVGVDYRNEEINVQVIEDNRQDNLYYLLGLRAATTLRDNSFLRRYKRLNYQAEGQFSNTWLSIVAGGQTTEENVLDGEHNWAVSRNFSRLNQVKTYLITNLTFKKEARIHSLKLNVNLLNGNGAEIIQKKELLPPFNQEVWVDVAENQSFRQQALEAELSYRFTKQYSKYMRNYALGIDVRLFDYLSEYRILDDKLAYQNLNFKAYYLKTFTIKRGLIVVEPSLLYAVNLKSNLKITDYDLQENITLPPYYQEIENRIVRPDFNYITSDFFMPALNLSYEREILKTRNKVFFKAGAHWVFPQDNSSLRKNYTITAGITL